MNLIPYILFATSLRYQGNLSDIALSACNDTAVELSFTNGQVFPRLAGSEYTYNSSRPFVGRSGLTIALNESMLQYAPLIRSLWDADVGCLTSSSKLWSGLNDSVTFSVNVNSSESPGPHCDGYYSNTTLLPPYNPWTSNHPVDGASVMNCDSTEIGWESSSNGKTCDNELQLLCVFDPNPATVSIALYELQPREIPGSKTTTSQKCDSVCLSSQKSAAIIYYDGETTRFPYDFLYANGMTGTTEVVVSNRDVNERTTLFSSFEFINVTALETISSSFFTGNETGNCNNFTSRSLCSHLSLNFNGNRTTSCGDIVPNILCACYNEAWETSTPTNSPSRTPTNNPSVSPTTSKPTSTPSTSTPSRSPTISPSSSLPTRSPTRSPTKTPV